MTTRSEDAAGVDVDDPGPGVLAIGVDANLTGGEADGRLPQLVNSHGHQSHRLLLARGHQHVQFSPGRRGADVVGQRQQLVGHVPPGADDGDDLLTRPLRANDALGGLLDEVDGSQ